MLHMTHNYMLGLATLVISFVVLFYMPIAYFWVKANQNKKRKQNKSWESRSMHSFRTMIGKT